LSVWESPNWVLINAGWYNGLARHYFPKGTDFAKLTAIEVQRVEDLLNNRPRKALNYHSTNEVFAKLTDPPENYALGM
jgi:IS30 family transposase